MDPLACTYATLFTEPAGRDSHRRGRAVPDAAGLVCVVEGDEGVRRAVASCVAIQLDARDVATLSTAEEVLQLGGHLRPALVLLNRSLPDMAGGECAEKLRAAYPQVPAVTYAIYDDSDQLFLSFAGVGAGYILRRRPPALLLEPLGPVGSKRTLSPDELARRVRRYFQGFFDEVPMRDIPAMARLTPREQETLEYLSKGYIDKEVAQRLGISAWTVHGHLQSIFRKLEVHTRTEAVVKYLQK
jgi:DNA-binding NarL/FixJ family response regulator